MNKSSEEYVSLEHKIFDSINSVNNILSITLYIKISGLNSSNYFESTQTLNLKFEKLPENLIELLDGNKFLINYIICLKQEQIFNVEITLTDSDGILQEQNLKIKRDDVIKYFNDYNNNLI